MKKKPAKKALPTAHSPTGALVSSRLIFESSPHGILFFDKTGRVIEANPAAERMLGFTRAQLRAMPVGDPHWRATTGEDGLPMPPDRHPTTIALREARAAGPVVMHVPRGGDGGMRWLSVSAMPLFRSRAKSPYQVMTTYVDITEHKQTEFSLRESKALLQRAERAAHIGSFALDWPTKRLRGSSGARQIYGLKGGSWSMDEIRATALPEYRTTLGEALVALVEHGEPYDMEYRIRRPNDGAVRNVRTIAEYDPQRRMVFGVLSDITERRTSELALRASEERFEKAFRSSPVIMTITELSTGIYLDVNDRFCEISGFARDEAIGKTATELGWIVPGTRESAVETLRQFGRLANREIRARTRSGEERLCLMSGELLALGGVDCLLVIVSDVTELKRAESQSALLEEQVQHLKRMDSIGRLAGGVAHDLNNVLTTVLTLTELQQAEVQPETELYGDLEAIMQACLRGQSTVRALLDFSRARVSALDLIDLNALIRDEVALLARTTLQKAHLTTDLDDSLPRVHGDRAALTHVFMNLCLNAVDAMPQGGTITVRTRRDGPDHLIAEVSDTGMGMPADVLEKALDPFFTTKPQGQGTGLGLSIVFGTVKAHGGTVDIRSAPGEGTTVVMRLPGVQAAD